MTTLQSPLVNGDTRMSAFLSLRPRPRIGENGVNGTARADGHRADAAGTAERVSAPARVD